MTLSRALLRVLAFAALPLWPAAAQVGGVPPGWSLAPPPQCQQLVSHLYETHKRGRALQAARQEAPPEEVCPLFKAFLAAESSMVKGLEENSATCSLPADIIAQVKAQHGYAIQAAKQVCEMALRGPARLDWPVPLCFESALMLAVPCVE